MRMTEQILIVADRYRLARDLSRSRVSTLIFNDGKKLDLIAKGAGLTTDKFEDTMQWFSNNWPADVNWPLGIARPEANKAKVA